MPRRKKNGQSPARVPGGLPEGGSIDHNTGYPLPQGFDSAMANNFPTSSVKERIVKSMQEMFSHLDPEVIYIVLSECDFKVENAMDSLLELSVAAEGAAPIPSPVSGFERTAAALLSPHHFSESRPDPDSSKASQLPCSPPSSNILTEELDLLVDQELETLTAQQGGSQYLSVGKSLSSFPPPPFQQQVLPELLQSSLQPGSRGPSVEQQGLVGSLAEHISGASSPLDNVSTWGDKTVGEQQSVDFTHLMTETPANKLKPPLDLAASGRPSAFQVYKKQDPLHTPSDKAGLKPSKTIVGGARSKVNTLNPEPLGYMPSSWNLQAPVFSPRIHEKQRPVFLTPVAQTPSNWPGQPRHASPWLSQGSVSQAPLKPSATIPKSWALPAAPHSPAHSRLRLVGKVLVLLRGAPGSGKSTLARAFLEHNPGGVILSTDDYFTRNGEYQFDPTALGEAHEWNHKQAKEAFERGANPIIIDNTNMQSWEMRPYVAQALKHGYKVLFREPDTWWKNKPRELERRSTHNVPVEKIRRMLNGYERYITVQAIMGSQMPEIKQRVPLENRSSQPVSSETPCLDLVGQPELAEGCMKSRPQLYSSLPDVSSISRSSEVGMMEGGTHKSTESLNFHPTGRLVENPVMSDGDDDMDLGELDSELDFELEMNCPTGDQRIPDCIVESVMSEDHRGDEVPVAFSESIAQRVRRERPSRRSGFDRLEPADLVKDANQSHGEEKGKEKAKEAERVEMELYEGKKGMPKTLDFVGDWPCEQRLVKQIERHKEGSGKEDGGVSQEATKNKAEVQLGPNVAEFQKLLDLIQTGVADVQTCSSRSSSRSSSLFLSSGEELEKEEAGGRFGESHGSRPNSEEREQDINRVNSSRGELPDCVLDWKAADSCKVRESTIDHYEGLKTETEASRTTGGNDNVSEIGRETGSVGLKSTNPTNPLSALTANSLVISKTVEANECHDGAGSHNTEGEVGTEPTVGHTDTEINNCTENGRETKVEADGSHVSEMCQSPVCVGSEEAESSSFSGGSQERKQRQGRRSGKQCKLALTFTQNCPASSPNSIECPNLNTAQSINHIQNSMNTDVEPNFNPDCNTSLKPKSDLFTKSESEAHLQPSSPLPLVDTGSPTQTEPQDFAFLWRLNRQDNAVITAGSHHSGITVLSGDSSRFVPEFSTAVSTAVASHPSGQRVVPYRVVHEKGTQVEEKELGATQDRLESLRILSCHFKLVSFDTLEDLYDKCYQDIEWTTNLLLDSGERFFRDDDGEKEEEEDGGADEENISSLCGVLGKPVGTRLHPDVLDEHHPEDWPKGEPIGFEEVTQQGTFATVRESNESSKKTDILSFEGAADPVRKTYHPDITSHLQSSPQTELSLPHAVNEGERWGDTEHKVTSEADLEGGAWGGSLDDGVIIEESRVEIDEEIASMDEVHRLLQAELEEVERDQKQMVEEKRHMEERRSTHLDIQSVELKLPTELALQLTELFGPVGVDPGKQHTGEKQRQATFSSHFFQEIPRSESQGSRPGSQDWSQPLNNQPETHGQMPFMDHWNVSRPQVSLRDIIKEQQALQKNEEKTRQSCADLDRRDGATLMKENQLFSLFPTIDRHFLLDIFRDHNHSLTQTELFLRSLLDQEPAKTVRQKPLELTVPDYQDTEDPEYEDFRAEASQQKSRQHECFSKAAEAYKQGRKDVASFYAQQGHLHGQRMREANHRAAVQIFKRVNSSLLPSNILDLHGLHVDEALEHLAKVLQDKTTDCEQGLCRPQLSVITGRGNHSQGGVARIRPAVIDYLNNKHYRFTEPKLGLVLVSLK
ncbi:hypothetical protein FQN60_011970 [Etheostoma spectabile]|uniref:Smr domain-containing protein n=1 Tax=Etheostoma spectabile TaxID=54343 RepID=A0A5J5DND8_9PERO|nr:hypothetical protein FQN60_011970 [Etheostoma spectabile]